MKNQAERFLDTLDWGIRQLRVAGILDMRQMIIVLRVLSDSMTRKRRFSMKEIESLKRREAKA